MMIQKWKQLQTNPVFENSPAGEKEIDKYNIRLTSKGRKLLIKDGKRNLYNEIQEAKEECDVIEIVRRAKAGDINAIQKIQAVNDNYGDATKAPKSLMEAKQQIIDAEEDFAQLPAEIRKEFNNNPNEFLAAADSGEIKNILQKYIKTKEKEPEKTTTSTNANSTALKNNEEVL